MKRSRMSLLSFVITYYEDSSGGLLFLVNNYFKTLWVVHYLFAGLLGLSIISSVDPVESFFIGLLGWSMIMRTLR